MIRCGIKYIEWGKSSMCGSEMVDQILDTKFISLVLCSFSQAVPLDSVKPEICSQLNYKSFIRCRGEILRIVDSAFDFKEHVYTF